MSQLIRHTLYHSDVYFFNRQDFVSDVKMRISWFLESICHSSPKLYNKMAVRFGPVCKRIIIILIFRTKSSFSMYKWHFSTYTSYVISQRCIFFNRQDFVSNVKIRISWFLESDCYIQPHHVNGSSFWSDAQAYINFSHNYSFSMYKWHVATDMSFVTSQQSVFFTW